MLRKNENLKQSQKPNRSDRRSWGLIALGAGLLIAAVALFWWGWRNLPRDVSFTDDKFIVRTPPSKFAGKAQSSTFSTSPVLTSELKTNTSASTFQQHASLSYPSATRRKEKSLKASHNNAAPLKQTFEEQADLQERRLNQTPAEAVTVKTQSVAKSQIKAEPLSSYDQSKPAPETQASASQTPQATPKASPTPPHKCANKGTKHNIFRRIINWVVHLFKKSQPEPCPNQPPTIQLSASPTTITLPCPGETNSSGKSSSSQMVQLITNAIDPDGDALHYTYRTTGGRVTGDGANVSWDLTGVQPGTYTVTVEVDDGNKGIISSSTTVTVRSCMSLLKSCPTINISCPTDQITAGTPATVSVRFSGGDPNASPTYNWSVSAGTISSGQGTPTITIDTTGLGNMNVTATVEIGGLSQTCDRKASCEFSLVSLPIIDYQKFDEYSDLKFSDEQARLDNFATKLQQAPDLWGYYIIFGSCEGEAAQRSARAIDYLVNKRGVSRDRIAVINGGCRETLTVEMWLCATDAPAPIPSNAATVDPCPACKARPRALRRSGSISGTVLDRNNKPIPGATVIAIDKDGNQAERTVTDSNGNYTITGLAPGEYTVRVIYKGVVREKSVSVIAKQATLVSPIALQVDAATATPEINRKILLREADQIKVTYPDKFLKGVGSTVTFELERVRVLKEIVQSQTVNTNTGAVEIVDRPRALEGAIENTVSPAINEGGYDTYVRVELSATGLSVPPEQAVQEKLYSRANDDLNRKLKQDWTWSLTPIAGFDGQAEIRFQVTVIWKSIHPEAYPDVEQPAWELARPVNIGRPAFIVYGTTYGSPVVALGAVGAFGFGAKRRRRLLAGGVEEDGVEDQPPMAAPGAMAAPVEEVGDEVSGTVYAPGQARLGDFFFVQVFLHLPEQAALLEEIAKESDEDAKKRDQAKLNKAITRGTKLTFHLTMPGLDIDDPEQSCVWQGEPERVRFGVTVPEGFKPKDIPATVIISENSVPIGHLRFKFKIVGAEQDEAAATASAQSVPVGNLIRYHQAFISYASKDRQEVLKRVQMLNVAKIKFFQDLLTLEPGDEWEKLLYDYIDKSDVFFLFWSTAASESEWVRKEVEYAIQRKAGHDEVGPEIIPVIIEGPPPAKPPAELSFLHFNDKFIYFINTRETESQA